MEEQQGPWCHLAILPYQTGFGLEHMVQRRGRCLAERRPPRGGKANAGWLCLVTLADVGITEIV